MQVGFCEGRYEELRPVKTRFMHALSLNFLCVHRLGVFDSYHSPVIPLRPDAPFVLNICHRVWSTTAVKRYFVISSSNVDVWINGRDCQSCMAIAVACVSPRTGVFLSVENNSVVLNISMSIARRYHLVH